MKSWYDDPPSNRQRKVLEFFDVLPPKALTKGLASKILDELSADKSNEELWPKYVYLTGDNSQASPHLMPYDLKALQAVVLPEDFRTPSQTGESEAQRAAAKREREAQKVRDDALVKEELKGGIPYDDPVPEIIYQGRSFSFTGDFEHGKRKTVCVPEVEKRDGIWHKTLKQDTDYLIVGARMSKAWKNKNYGKKIRAAVCNRVVGESRTKILAEEDWVASLEGAKLVPIK